MLHEIKIELTFRLNCFSIQLVGYRENISSDDTKVYCFNIKMSQWRDSYNFEMFQKRKNVQKDKKNRKKLFETNIQQVDKQSLKTTLT